MKLKMFGKYSVSSLLFWVFSILLMIEVLYILFFIVSGVVGHYELQTYNDYYSYLFDMPFTNSRWSVRMDTKGLISFLFPFIKTGLLFYLLVLIFKSLKQDELIFKESSIKYLKFFAIFNICLPIVYSLFDLLMFKQWVYLNVMPSLPNFIIGLFTLFVLAIFKQGFQIQQENELTI
ncbi:DUF2975 domain-containing protein [Lacinutrix algicola]|uniref:DUF2975 domain-containing protein n=1 Tax=Lacinutrix algicola TaxID=342954 RepID=UPI001364B68E|nr:DUF2975 domain-containing protein [Lacinutrix algicola]